MTTEVEDIKYEVTVEEISYDITVKKIVNDVEVSNEVGPRGPKGETGAAGVNSNFADNFETTSKNLRSWDYDLNYTNGVLTSIVYDDGVNVITKTLGYSGGALSTITLSGDTPNGIDLIKTLSYTDGQLTGITYS